MLTGIAACSGGGPTATASSPMFGASPSTSAVASVPADSASPSGSVSAPPELTALASHVAAASAPTSSESPPPGTSEAPFPNATEAQLLSHVVEGLRPTCERADQFYADEVDSVSCGGDPDPFVDYTMFASVEELRAAFADDVQQSELPPVPNGTCAAANYQSTYQLGGTPAGRLQCTLRTANGQTYRVIEWTRDKFRILAYLSSSTVAWDDMIAFWKARAGPAD